MPAKRWLESAHGTGQLCMRTTGPLLLSVLRTAQRRRIGAAPQHGYWHVLCDVDGKRIRIVAARAIMCGAQQPWVERILQGNGEATADVIVVGGGGAGLAAAAEAARLGRKTILFEKNPSLGGSTAWSVGSISASNTPHQLAQGILDTPDEHFEDLEALAGGNANRDNRALRRILVDHSNEMLNWLMSIGLVFVGPNIEPPHRQPRMHNVLPNSKAFPDRLGRHCRELGVDICLNAKAQKLIVDGGRVRGVVVNLDGQRREYTARGGVVLASGDYSASAELKGRYAGETAAQYEPVN